MVPIRVAPVDVTDTPTPTADGAPVRRGRPGYDSDELVSVATRVFTERGYHGTSMTHLAAELGISKAAIYHHVSGKEEILARALGRALDALEAALDRARRAEADPRSRLERAVRDSVAVLVRELPSVTLLLRVRGTGTVEQQALERRREIDRTLTDLVTDAQAAGALRSDIDAALVARLVFGTVNSIVEWYRPGRGDDAAVLADALCTLVFDGLRRP